MFPLAVWQPGTLQPSTPVNDNALRVEVLQRGAISILSTPPGSPADGDVHIVGASPTGAWSTFAQHDVVMWRSGTWYRFAPFTGWLKQVGSDVRRFTGTAWDVVSGGGGGAVPIQDEGSTVVSSPTAINFVGAGVTTTNSSGVATVTIPGADPAPAEEWQTTCLLVARPGSTNLDLFGWGNPVFIGATNGISTIAGTNGYTSTLRRTNSATASTTSISGLRGADRRFLIGASPYGGFDIEWVWAIDNGADNSSHRLFCGLRGSDAAATDVNPSTLTDVIGVGYDSSDSNFVVIHNDASGTATKTAFDSAFAKPTANQQVYKTRIVCLPGASSVTVTIRNCLTGASVSKSVSTDLPGASVLLNILLYLSAGGVNAQTGVSHCTFRGRSTP